MGLDDLLGDAWGVAKKVNDFITSPHGVDAQVLDDIKGTVMAPVHLAVDVATSFAADNPKNFVEDLGGAVTNFAGATLKPLGDAFSGANSNVLTPILNVDRTVYKQGVDRPLGTLFLLPNSHIGFDVGAAWNATRDMDMGAPAVNLAFGHLNPSQHGGVFDSGWDPTNPDDRTAAASGFGKYATGVVNFGTNWVSDPLVLAGHALGILRQAKVVKPIISEGTAARGILSTRLGAKLAPSLTTPTDIEKAVTTGRVPEILDHLASLNKDTRAQALSVMPAFKGSADIQHVLTEADDATQMGQELRYAMDPSPIHEAQLAAERRDAVNQINYLRDTHIPALQRAFTTASTAAVADPNAIAGLQRSLDAANTSLQAADRTGALALSRLNARASLTAIPRFTSTDRAAMASGWEVYQPSRYSFASRILRSAGAGRVSVVDLNRDGDAVRGAQAMLDRTGHGWGSDTAAKLGAVADTQLLRQPVPGEGLTGRVEGPRVITTPPAPGEGGGQNWAARGQPVRAGNVGIDAVTKGRLMAKVAAASNDPTASKAVLAEVEQHVFNFYADKIPGLVGADKEQLRRDIMQAAQARRDQIAGQMGSRAGDVFSGAKDTNGRYLDEITDPMDTAGVGDKIHGPLTTGDLVDKVPLLDVDQLARAIRLHADTMNPGDWRDVVANLRGGANMANPSAMATEMLDKLNRVWKPAQLLRLGWPMRVITDENLRIMATLGAMVHLPLLLSSAKQYAGETKTAYRVRDYLNAGGRVQSQEALAAAAPLRAAGLEKAGIIDQIHAADTRLADLDNRHIPAAGQALANASLDTAGTPLYRNAPARARHGTDGAGVTFSTTPTPAVGEDITHVRLATMDASKVFNPTSSDLNPGVAALRDLTNPTRFAQLEAMKVKDLRAMLSAQGGFNAARYTNRDALLAAYGAHVARSKGYSAIARGDQYTALSDDALRHADPQPVWDADTRLTALMDEHREITAAKQNLAGREAALPTWTADYENNWAALQTQARKSLDVRAEVGKKTPFSGTTTVTLADGSTRVIKDVFNGDYGPIYVKLTSAGGIARSLSGIQDRSLNGMRIKAGQVTTLKPFANVNATAIETKLNEKAYSEGWERAINQQIRTSPLAMKILGGADDRELLTYLSTDPKGMEERALMGVWGRDANSWIDRLRQHVVSYLPTPELRAAALAGDVKAPLLNSAFAGQLDQRPMIHGESLSLETGRTHLGSLTNRLVEHLYNVVGTVPTDVLSRQPFAAAVYRKSMTEQIGALKIAPTDVITGPQMEAMQRRAHELTVSKVRSTLYDLSNESHLGHTMRFVAPFWTAWQEALSSWGKLFLDDPSRMMHAVQLEQGPKKIGLTYTKTNPDGTTTDMIAIPLPGFMRDHLGLQAIDKVGMPTTYFRDLVAQGQYWYMPGTGAPVAIPVSALARDKPNLYDTLKPLIPYGAGEHWYDPLLPSGYQKIQAAGDDDARSYAMLHSRIALDLATEHQIGKNPATASMTDTQLVAEAKRRTDALQTLKIASNFISPFAPDYHSPYQFYIDQARAMKTDYQNRYAHTGGVDENGLNWQEAFTHKYGDDYFYMTQSQTKSNVGGVSPTSQGFLASQKYLDLIGAHPEWGGLIAGASDPNASYNAEVAHYQERNPISASNSTKQREVLDPKQAIDAAQVTQGWDKFRQLTTAIDTALIARGIHSVNNKGAEDLKHAKEITVAQMIKDLPAWALKYDTLQKGGTDRLISFLDPGGGAKGFLDTPGVIDRPGWRAMAQYLSTRRTFTAALAARKAGGGTDNMAANGNADIRGLWDASALALREQDLAFGDLYNRWLGSDPYNATPVVDQIGAPAA